MVNFLVLMHSTLNCLSHVLYLQTDVICQHFRLLLQRVGCDINLLQQQEWPAFKAYANRLRHLSTSDLLHRVLTNPDQMEHFQNLKHIFIIFLSLPSSSAVCEQGFSAMKRIKSDWRACLKPEMMDRLMAISTTGPKTEEYDPHRAVQLWLDGGRRIRRYQGLVIDSD